MLIHYCESITCYRVVCSGFFDSVGLYRTCSSAQRAAARASMDRLGIAHLARKDFTELSSGQQCMVLIARAIVKSPALLVLDEPCQGLDSANTDRIRHVVDTACAASEIALIYVTHRLEELPTCITHVLKLRRGRVVRKGTRTAILG
jgi:molybdate transport system ATP-binding protein